MSIDPKTLPHGTVVKWENASGSIGGISLTPLGFQAHRVTRLFVPVPDGMSVKDAEKALAEHVAWVPLPRDRWTSDIHAGARLRVVASSGDVHLVSAARRDAKYIVTDDYLYGGHETESVFIHPDDVPAGDAELINKIIDALSGHALDDPEFNWEDAAHDALAVVREHEGGTR